MDVYSLLVDFEHTTLYLVLLIYFAWYPMGTSAMWIYTALIYYFRREQDDPTGFYRLTEYPLLEKTILTGLTVAVFSQLFEVEASVLQITIASGFIVVVNAGGLQKGFNVADCVRGQLEFFHEASFPLLETRSACLQHGLEALPRIIPF